MEGELQRLQALLMERGCLNHIHELIKQEEERKEVLRENVGGEEKVDNFNGGGEGEATKNQSHVKVSTQGTDDDGGNGKSEIIKEGSKHKSSSATAPKSDERNPLKNEYILRMLFNLCSVETLKNCRLVSTEWRDLSLEAWRSKAVLRLSRKTGHDSPIPFRGASVRFRKFLNFMVPQENDDDDPFQLRKYPFQGYRLNLYNSPRLEKDIAECIAPFTRHLTLCDTDNGVDGLQRTYLKQFHKLESLELNSFVEIIYFTRNPSTSKEFNELSCPNLKRLKIKHTRTSLKNDQYWEILFKRLPSLESLIIEISRDYVDGLTAEREIGLILDSLRKTRDPKNSKNLKELEILEFPISGLYRRSDDLIQLLINCKFPLERLSIALEQNTQLETVQRLLKHFKNTLQYLRISPPGYFDDDNKKKLKLLPGGLLRLKHLKELHLVNGITWGMHFLSELELPSLEKLVVEKVSEKLPGKVQTGYQCLPIIKSTIEDILLSFRRGCKYEALKYFELRVNEKPLSLETMKSFGEIMPNLEHLIIPLDKHAFRIVCGRFQKLKTLNVLEAQSDYEEMDDEALTGYAGESERLPNISDLKNLTDLNISCERQLLRKDVKFTELSVTYGLLEVPKLHYLSMAFRELSEDAMTKLENHVRGTVHFQEARVGLRPAAAAEYTDCDVKIDVDDDGTRKQWDSDVEAIECSTDEDSSNDEEDPDLDVENLDEEDDDDDFDLDGDDDDDGVDLVDLLNRANLHFAF